MIDLTPTAEAIQTLVEAALPGTAVYWTAESVPTRSQPAEMVIIEPLFPIVTEEWGERRYAQHVVQVRACARTIGRASALADDILAALPATEYAVRAAGPLIKSGNHYDYIVTVVNIPAT